MIPYLIFNPLYILMIILPLQEYPETIATLGQIWYEQLGQKFYPHLSLQDIIEETQSELDCQNVCSFVALVDKKPIGFTTYRLKEDFALQYGPWLADVVIDKPYQKQGVGQKLIQHIIQYAKNQEHDRIYLITFDRQLIKYYEPLGWQFIEIQMIEKLSGYLMSYCLSDAK